MYRKGKEDMRVCIMKSGVLIVLNQWERASRLSEKVKSQELLGKMNDQKNDHNE